MHKDNTQIKDGFFQLERAPLMRKKKYQAIVAA
jgi:hypothetical protein